MRREAELFYLENDQLVMIAFHLHKKCFSIRNAKSRKVIGYTNRIIIRDVFFPVSASGRQRALNERKKNVHAFVKGSYDESLQSCDKLTFREAYYNPYLVSSFVDRETFEPIEGADIVLCDRGKVYYWRADV